MNRVPVPDVIGDDRPPRRNRRLPTLMAGVAALAVAAFVWWPRPDPADSASQSSPPPPRSNSSPDARPSGPRPVLLRATTGYSVRARTDAVVYGFQVVNRGFANVEVVEAGRSGPGLELETVQFVGGALDRTLGTRASRARVLPPDGRLTIRLHYRLLDCAQLHRGSWPVPVAVRQGGVVRTEQVQPPPTLSGDPWQLSLSQPHC